MCKAGISGARFAVCSLRFWLARDARHHGRYGPEGGLRRAVQKTAENPQLQFIKVVFIPVVMQRRIPCLTDHRNSPVT